MKRDLLNSAIAIVVLTVVLGLAYPLLFTGVAQVVSPGNANGSKIHQGGRVIGSKLIGQDFRKPVLGKNGKPEMGKDGKPVLVADPRWFQSRPSQTTYDPSVTFFSNLGPNSADAQTAFKSNLDAYLKLEGRYTRGLS